MDTSQHFGIKFALYLFRKGVLKSKEGDLILIAAQQKLDLGEILKKAEQESTLSEMELSYLLNLSEKDDREKVFKTARKLRERHFGCRVFLYGFVYFSTFCRNDCAFCMYRKSNYSFGRYRKTEQEILVVANRLMESGVHLLDLTMGEDPHYVSQSAHGSERLFRMVEAVKKSTGMPLMISPGVVSQDDLSEFLKLGVDWYACYQETHNKALFSRLRLGQSYEERLDIKTEARKRGMLIEEGLLAGVGETTEDVIHSLETMQKLRADQVRVMSFVPQNETPMSNVSPVSRNRELLIIALMRLVMPDRLIPASLDVDGLLGLTQRLEAGANVVTSIIPPLSGLAGVSQSSLDIEDGNRTVSKVRKVLERLGLAAASRDEYGAWVKERRQCTNDEMKGAEACG